MMKTVLAGAALLGVLAVVPAAHAEGYRYSPLSGERLMYVCTKGSNALIGACNAYLDGVSDAITSYQAARPQDGRKGAPLPAYICVPGHLTGPQLRQAVVAWGEQHRNELNGQASAVVIRALLQTYPCQSQ
ncbi:MAG: hypothetical protein JO157_16695 [Acetobacteraceae bacterium]|nr:hypothetical protein [Acetobacteraceae bacterium]